MRIGVGAGVILLLVAMVVAVVVTTFAPRGGVRDVGSEAAGTRAPVGAGAGAEARSGTANGPATPGPVLLVHVLGAVARPGIVELRAGSRVVDAIASAGGLTADANAGGVNLARPVSDGEQIVVPREGEAVPDAVAGGETKTAAGSGPVNINLGSVSDLQALPRIGPALAQRIVDWRESNGRFTAPADLMKVAGIGQTLFDGLKDLITV